MQENLSIAIPDGIPLPRFLPFQRVRLKSGKPQGSRVRVGIVVGFEYTTPITALAMNWPVGWDYIIDWFYETPDGQLIGLSEVRQIFGEKCLELIEDQPDRPHETKQPDKSDQA